MSLFRKPKKPAQRRVFCADDDEDGEPEPPPPPVISLKKENKPSKTLLSFADEEEDGEVFKVKKSSQSKKLSKKRDKEKKKGPDSDNSNKNDFNNHEIPKDPSPEKQKKKKKVSLEGLILSGRAALAAGGSDMETSGSEGSDAEGDGGFHTYRADSVRAALKPGHIPDAALIHAARKTRQQARELGDFVPLREGDGEERGGGGGGGRLVRDDDDDDEEEGRIHVRGLQLPSDKPERDTEAAEVESAGEEWEEQQLMKAMPALNDVTGPAWSLESPGAGPGAGPGPGGAPPPPRLQGPLRPLALLQPNNAQELIQALSKRMSEVETERDEAAERVRAAHARLSAARQARHAAAARAAPLARRYTRAQAARGYITDLVECLDEKLPEIEALEARALALHKRRCEAVTERRRADVRDQAQDVLSIAGRAGSVKAADTPEKVRRAAEREGRRRARRLRRGPDLQALHRDGDSSDNELPPDQHTLHQQEREAILAGRARVFADAGVAWRGVRGVCARVAAWRAHSLHAYHDAYVAACLPKLLAPYVRHQLILWNPLADEDNEDYEKMDWYKTVMMYGVKPEKLSDDSDMSDDEEAEWPGEVTERSVRDDPDLMLVPTLVTRVVLPKLTELVESAWEPLCVRSCVRLRGAVLRAALLPGAHRELARLGAALSSRLAATINADIFLPTLPPQVIEGPGGVFWRRQLASGVRLLRAVLALAPPPALLNIQAPALLIIERLCTAAGAAPGAAGALAATWLAEALPRGPLRPAALRRLARLASTAAARLQRDNPLHMKALEQVKTLLAEAKAYEE